MNLQRRCNGLCKCCDELRGYKQKGITKKWVSVESLIKELNKYHNGIHPTCNICNIIKQLKGEEIEEESFLITLKSYVKVDE